MNTSLNGQEQTPKKRPVYIVVIGVVFITLGLLDIWRGAIPLTSRPAHLAGDDLTVLSIGIAALLGGIFVLKGRDWARWLLAIWIALHVALSIRDPYVLLAHLAIFGLILVGLFHPAAAIYFRQRDT
jgi:hypothetical protein